MLHNSSIVVVVYMTWKLALVYLMNDARRNEKLFAKEGEGKCEINFRSLALFSYLI